MRNGGDDVGRMEIFKEIARDPGFGRGKKGEQVRARYTEIRSTSGIERETGHRELGQLACGRVSKCG